MKKLCALMLAMLILAALAGCGRKHEEPKTQPSTEPITIPTVPDMTMPSSNIPDPTVDSNSGNGETEAPTK